MIFCMSFCVCKKNVIKWINLKSTSLLLRFYLMDCVKNENNIEINSLHTSKWVVIALLHFTQELSEILDVRWAQFKMLNKAF